MDKKEVLKWITSGLFALSIIILLILITFFNNNAYYKGYEKNQAYERVDANSIIKITENTQNYFLYKEELKFFDGKEAKHMQEVRSKIKTGFIVSLSLIIIAISGVIYLNKKTNEKNSQRKKITSWFKKTGICILGLATIFIILGSFWDWFFIKFHEVLFSGQWMFNESTLMIQLWGGNFFQTIAKIIILRIISLGIILVGIGFWIKNLKNKMP